MTHPAHRLFSARRALFILLVVLSLALQLSAQEPPAPPTGVVAVIPLEGFIDQGLHESVKRRISEVKTLNPSLIVFEIETYGGLADAAMEITDTIGAVDTALTVAYIPVKAYSAGAMIAMGAREIALGPLASIGDAAPVATTSEGPQELGEKFQSPVRNIFRKYAQRNGYNVALSESMVSKDIVVYEVDFDDETSKYMSQEELDALTEKEASTIERKAVVVKEGEILTMSAEDATKYGFAKFVVKDLAELMSSYDLGDAAVETLRTNWSEWLVRKLNHPAVTGILMLIGIIGIYTEFKVPGFGLPGTVAIICFATLFFSKYLVGMALYWEGLIIIVGMILLALELFVIPGFGVTGTAGIALMLAGLVLIIMPQNITSAQIDTDYLLKNLLYVAGSLVVAFFVALGLAKVLPKTPLLSAVYLGEPAPESVPHAGAATLTEGREGLVGKTGVAQTALRPAGKALIDDEPYDVTTRGDHVPEGTRIEVVARKGNNIIVRRYT